ncbi:MAG: hypothetical protein LBJ64_05410 [Deltaproteobacteria bacterium]|jgi:cell division protein FtsZ|nr:hypothetical protein [Deltaproteobacteria bacterium]
MMTDNFITQVPENEQQKIVVFGIGGCAYKAINYMVKGGLKGPKMVAANTDVVDLNRCLAEVKIQIGPECTKGNGSGADPNVGRQAAEESMSQILPKLEDADLVFVTCGLGGGTGTGGAPAVVQALNKVKQPPLIVSVVVLPFEYERDRVMKAKPALESLLADSHCLIGISNEKLVEHYADLPINQCKDLADSVLFRAVSCISELVENCGEINLDFADIRAALSAKGRAIMGLGEASGENRGVRAVEMAITCPLMENQSIEGAKYLLVNVTADDNIKMREMDEIHRYLTSKASPDVKVYSGLQEDNSLTESGLLKVTVIATGLPYSNDSKPVRRFDEDDEPITLDLETEPQINLISSPQVDARQPSYRLERPELPESPDSLSDRPVQTASWPQQPGVVYVQPVRPEPMPPMTRQEQIRPGQLLQTPPVQSNGFSGQSARGENPPARTAPDQSVEGQRSFQQPGMIQPQAFHNQPWPSNQRQETVGVSARVQPSQVPNEPAGPRQLPSGQPLRQATWNENQDPAAFRPQVQKTPVRQPPAKQSRVLLGASRKLTGIANKYAPNGDGDPKTIDPRNVNPSGPQKAAPSRPVLGSKKGAPDVGSSHLPAYMFDNAN